MFTTKVLAVKNKIFYKMFLNNASIIQLAVKNIILYLESYLICHGFNFINFEIPKGMIQTFEHEKKIDNSLLFFKMGND